MFIRLSFLKILLPLAAVSLAIIVGPGASHRAVAAPATQARHGLPGYYYLSNLEAHGQEDIVVPGGTLSGVYYQEVWFDPNDFQLPKPAKNAAATRIDTQIAFGKGKGFASHDGKQFVWWATDYPPPQGWPNPNDHPWDYTAAVMWKGYIHLPKPGTYYFTTISEGPSAVYLNEARVALNGIFGGILSSDAFAFAKDDVHDFVQNLASGRQDIAFGARPGDAYIVPVTVDAPRDLPIEVDYNAWAKGAAGIDLFWVTPDSPRDANGKPLAQVVPADALYVDPPGSVEKSPVRGASSSIMGDLLYVPVEHAEKPVTLTIRLADQNGHPVSGKRVHISGLVSFGGADTIIQPDKPTDENGVTKATLMPAEGLTVAHDSTLIATDVTDLVDVAQVAHVTFQLVNGLFFPDTYAPYYDDQVFQVEPLPLMLGRPVTLKVPLENRSAFAANLTVTFRALELNIGAFDWPEIGKVDHVALKPGESREVSITWTPQQAVTHLCFEIELSGHFMSDNGSTPQVQVAVFLPLLVGRGALVTQSPNAQDTRFGSLQRNIGPVFNAGVNYVNEKLGGGKLPLGEGCTFDLRRARLACGVDINLKVKGTKLGGMKTTVSCGADESHDPQKMLQCGTNVSVQVGPYEKTISDKSSVVPAPAINKVFDENNPNNVTRRALKLTEQEIDSQGRP